MVENKGTATASLQVLQEVEQRIVQVVEVAAGIVEELGSSEEPQTGTVTRLCQELIQEVREIQSTLRDQIRGMIEYRPYDNCDYVARSVASIGLRKVGAVIERLQQAQGAVDRCVAVGSARPGGRESEARPSTPQREEEVRKETQVSAQALELETQSRVPRGQASGSRVEGSGQDAEMTIDPHVEPPAGGYLPVVE